MPSLPSRRKPNNKNKVVILPNGQNKPKVKNQKVNGNIIRVNNNKLMSRDNFLLALISPFAPEAFGVRVPDPFPFPTVTHHLHQTSVIGVSFADTGGAVAYLPSPVLSLIDINRVNGLNPTVSTTPFTRVNSLNTTSAFHMYGATTEAALKNVYATSRIVSWGIKISNLQPQLSATGRIIVAMIPLGDTIPSLAEYKSTFATGASILTPIFGSASSTVGSSAVLQLPSAQQFAVSDLLHGDLEVSGMYTNSSFWQFKTSISTSTFTTGTQSGDSSLVASSGGIIQSTGYKDSTRMVGGCAIVLYFEGLPTGTTNAFQVESVYHLEGSPQLGVDSITVPIPSGAEKTIIGTSDSVDRSMGIASRLENVFTFITKGADFLNRNSDAINKVAKTITSAAMFL